MSNALDAQKNNRFQKIAMPNMQALYAMAIKLTHNERDAEDLVQDTMIKAYNHFDSFEEGTNCRAWLFRILTNTFINKYRRKQRERIYIENTIIETKNNIQSNSPENELSTLETEIKRSFFYGLSDEVLSALNSTSEDFKSIVVMADVEDKSYKEIADYLHIPIGTVMSRLCRGRRLLRNLLTGYAKKCGYTTHDS